MRNWTSAYDVFYNYFDVYDMKVESTLKAYGLIDGRVTPDKVSSAWSSFKTKYREEYIRAKEDYLEFNGVTPTNIISSVWNIAQTATLDRDRLRALELLAKIYIAQAADANVINQANKLTIEVVPALPQNDMLSDNDMVCIDSDGKEKTWREVISQ